MATRRKQIIDGLVVELGQTPDVSASNVFRHFKYLDEINDFPSICLLPRNEARIERGANRRLGIIEVALRGYTFDENNLDRAEFLAQNVEAKVDSFSANTAAKANGVSDVRVVTFRTDEGLFEPYGIADLELQILYDVEEDV
tara:strand:+ start:23 stop:448 length:426 start_codon:yes stop_codon:yes gene_type:complete